MLNKMRRFFKIFLVTTFAFGLDLLSEFNIFTPIRISTIFSLVISDELSVDLYDQEC